MKYLYFLTAALLIGATACKKSQNTGASDLVKDHKPVTTSSSFYPMQIGNYWKINDQNYTQIEDTLRIEGKLYYKFYALIGGDAAAITYLRVDENQNLYEAIPTDTTFHYLRAKFAANVNETFNTLNNQNINNLFVKVIYKSDTKIQFQLNSTLPNANSTLVTDTFYKGIGPDDHYATIKINGIVYNY